jgi:hypothetical protein
LPAVRVKSPDFIPVSIFLTMSRVATVLCFATCFGTGFGVSRWIGHPGFAGGAPGNPLTTVNDRSRASKHQTDREEKIHPSANADFPLTVCGMLEAAGKRPPLQAEAALMEALRQLPTDRRKELFKALNAHSGPESAVMMARRALLRLWAAEDPDGALQALTESARPWSGANVEIVVNELTARGWDFAHSRLGSLPGSVGARGRELLAKWAIAHAPDKVAVAMKGYLEIQRGGGGGMNPEVIRDWAQADRKAAEAWIAGIPTPRLMADARRQFCLGLAKRDFQEAERWIETLPGTAGKDELRGAMAEEIVREKSPEEAARFLAEHPEADSGLQARLVRSWAQADPNAALAWAKAQPEDSGVRKAALEAWVGVRADSVKSWQDVLTLADSMPGEENRRNCIAQALTRLPPAEAAAHLDEATGDWRWAAWNQVMHGSPELPLDQALALAPRYAEENKGDGGIDPGFLTQRLAGERGPEAALDWCRTLPDNFRERAVAGIWENWADQDPAAALRLADSLTENKERQDALTAIASAWAQKDSLAASEWFSRQPPGPARDAAAAGMVPQLVQTDPGGALIWAAAITDSTIRESTLRAVRPPASFAPTDHWRAAVESSGLSARDQKLLLNQP